MVKIIETEHYIFPKDNAHQPCKMNARSYWYDAIDNAFKCHTVKYHDVTNDGKVTIISKNIHLDLADYPLKHYSDDHVYYEKNICYDDVVSQFQMKDGELQTIEYDYTICTQTRVVDYEELCDDASECDWLINKPSPSLPEESFVEESSTNDGTNVVD